jgi:hypothetical protein
MTPRAAPLVGRRLAAAQRLADPRLSILAAWVKLVRAWRGTPIAVPSGIESFSDWTVYQGKAWVEFIAQTQGLGRLGVRCTTVRRPSDIVLYRRSFKLLTPCWQCSGMRSGTSAVPGFGSAPKLIVTDLLIIDDFALDAMDPVESRDAYEIFIERHGAGSTIVTSNRGPDEWLATFADPVSAQSAIDRFTSNSYDLVIDGESYRSRLKPTLYPRQKEAN